MAARESGKGIEPRDTMRHLAPTAQGFLATVTPVSNCLDRALNGAYRALYLAKSKGSNTEAEQARRNVARLRAKAGLA